MCIVVVENVPVRLNTQQAPNPHMQISLRHSGYDRARVSGPARSTCAGLGRRKRGVGAWAIAVLYGAFVFLLCANPSTRTSNRNPHQTHTACIRTKSSRWPMSQRPCFRSPPSWAPWAVWALQAWLQAAAVLGRLGASRLRRSLTPRYVARATAERAPRLSFATDCSSTC